jgi:MarR family transcriptional regulator, 2-MHQ and catechol-resistance regulon repressor
MEKITGKSKLNHDSMKTGAIDLLKTMSIINKILYLKLGQLDKADVDITPRCFDIMRLLFEEGPMNISAIGKKLLISKAQMTQLVARLVRQHVVVKQINKDDKRNYVINLNKLGEKTVETHLKSWELASHEIFISLSKKENEEILRLLHKIQKILGTSYPGL